MELTPEQEERMRAHNEMLNALLAAHNIESTFSLRMACDIGYKAGVEATVKAMTEAFQQANAETQSEHERLVRERKPSRWAERLEQMKREHAAGKRQDYR